MAKDVEKNKREMIRMIKFFLFSCSAGVIQVVSFTILNQFIFNKFMANPYWPCYLISVILSVIWNFTINRKFTFKSTNNIAIAMTKVALYYVAFIPLSTLWGNALTGLTQYKVLSNEYFVLIFTMIINLVTEFLFTKFVVYGKNVDNNDVAKKEQAKKGVGENKDEVNEETSEVVQNTAVEENKDEDSEEK